MVAVPAPEDLRRVLDDDGKPLPGAKAPALPEDALVRIFDTMVRVRVVDDRMAELHAQSRIGFYLRARGEEATHFAVAALRDGDWVFPSYRELGAWFWRGYTIEQFVDQLFGNAGDLAKGRQLPCHHAASALHLVSISTPVGTQIPQAVGAAYAAKALGKDDVAMTFFGDAAGATGEFHVGLNFAGVWKTPCVFVCRNTGRPMPNKAVGYGIPRVRVDGHDVLAVWQAASEAIERARSGGGPTFIEALAPPGRDPLARLRGYLRVRGLGADDREREVAAGVRRELDAALVAADSKRAPAVSTMFDDVYEQLPWHLREQRASVVGSEK